jgi:hypothetical protein
MLSGSCRGVFVETQGRGPRYGWRPTDSNPHVARHMKAQLWGTVTPDSLHRTPGRTGTGRDGWGCQGTTGAADGPFAHVTANDQDQAGTEREAWGAAGVTCKSSASAYPGSNPVFATAPTRQRLSPSGPGHATRRAGFPLPDALPTPVWPGRLQVSRSNGPGDHSQSRQTVEAGERNWPLPFSRWQAEQTRVASAGAPHPQRRQSRH